MVSADTLLPLPGRRRLDMAQIGAAGTGGLSLPGQEGLTGASVGESVFSRHLLQGHTLKKMDVLIRSRPHVQPRGQTTLSTMPERDSDECWTHMSHFLR